MYCWTANLDGSMLTRVGQKIKVVCLLSALQILPASLRMPSKRGNKKIYCDIENLVSAIVSKCYNLDRFKPLTDAVLSKQPDEVIWNAVYELVPPFCTPSSSPLAPWSRSTDCSASSTEHHGHIDAPDEMQCKSSYLEHPME